MSKRCGVYIILSPSNRCYIGSSKNIQSRKSRHFRMLEQGIHHCSALQRAWDKYAGELIFRVIEECHEDIRIEREQWWIDNHLVEYGRMYNSSSIAARPEHTAEVRAKISQSAKDRVVSDETRKRLSFVGTGRKHKPETIAKIKAYGFIGVAPSVEHHVKMIAAKALKGTSDATRKKMSDVRKGVRPSAEALVNMSAAQQRRVARDGPMKEETKEKLRQPRGKYRPRSPEAVKAFLAGNPLRSENSKKQRLREHMARLDWITGSNYA